MNQSKPIKDPSTFGKTLRTSGTPQNTKEENGNDRTTYSFNEQTHGIKCPKGTKDGVYHCEICDRLRRVCPYSSSKTEKNTTFILGQTSTFGNRSFHEGRGRSINNGRQTASFVNSHYYTPPPIRKEPRIIEEIIYMPVIHNVLVPQPQPQNPQKNVRHDYSYESPKYKYRHQSGTTKQPFSSPIKVEDYYRPEQIMTPSQLKKMTESMIA